MEYARGSLIIKEGDVGSIVYVMEGESKDIRFPPKKCSLFPNFPDLWPSGFFLGGEGKGKGWGIACCAQKRMGCGFGGEKPFEFPFPLSFFFGPPGISIYTHKQTHMLSREGKEREHWTNILQPQEIIVECRNLMSEKGHSTFQGENYSSNPIPPPQKSIFVTSSSSAPRDTHTRAAAAAAATAAAAAAAAASSRPSLPPSLHSRSQINKSFPLSPLFFFPSPQKNEERVWEKRVRRWMVVGHKDTLTPTRQYSGREDFFSAFITKA